MAVLSQGDARRGAQGRHGTTHDLYLKCCPLLHPFAPASLPLYSQPFSLLSPCLGGLSRCKGLGGCPGAAGAGGVSAASLSPSGAACAADAAGVRGAEFFTMPFA